MTKPQYGILRFAKYKGPEIGRIEAHNERTKEIYASNPDVDTERSKYNFHLVKPNSKYRAEAEKQIAEVGCRTRTDSVRVVETLDSLSRAEEQLASKLTDEEKELFMKYAAQSGDFLCVSNADSFIVGFRLGARFTYDTFIDKKG